MDEKMLILNYKGKNTKELKQGVISLKAAIFEILKWVLGLGKSFFQFAHTVNKIFKPRKEQTLKRRFLAQNKSCSESTYKTHMGTHIYYSHGNHSEPLNCTGKYSELMNFLKTGEKR